MLKSPKRDIPKTLHKIFYIVHDRLTFTLHGSCSPAPALHGWSSLCKAAKSKEIYASPTDAFCPKGLASHRYTFWHPAGICITFCRQQCLLHHFVWRLNEAFMLCWSCTSVVCCEVYCAIWEGDVLSTTIARENGDHVILNEVRGDWSDSTLRSSST